MDPHARTTTTESTDAQMPSKPKANEGAPTLSVVVPLRDEVESIPVLAEEIEEALDGAGIDWECIWVDDGSEDRSLEILRELVDSSFRHRYLSFDRNYGQSAALLAGFRAARAPLLATLDADLQSDPADLPGLVEELEVRSVGMVTGVRRRRHDSWIRRLSSRIANGFRNLLTAESVTDVGCSVRVFRREYAVCLPGFRGMHRFLPTLVRLQGCEVAEVPVTHRPRVHGETKYGIHNRLWVGIVDTLGVRWLKARWARPRIAEASNLSRQEEES